ncbi:MAG: hypothetical protein LUG93_03565 [Lachnospiraceae bacterium]|nr:hypothetical protein [Lachnospiraceae bacterium]
MTRFVIYTDDRKDIQELEQLLRKAVLARREWPLVQTYVGDENFRAYLQFVRQNPYLIMVAAVTGPEGRQKAMRIREINWEARMLWFSDKSNETVADSIGITAFGLLPASMKEMESALDACQLFSNALASDSRALV